MANKRLYFGLEDLNLNASQRQTLVEGLQALGVFNNDNNPGFRNHWRIRLDNRAIIFEAWFDEDTLTISAIKNRLATIFGVPIGNILHSLTYSPA